MIENIQRDNLNVLETAEAYQKLREQFNLTAKQIGERVGGRSESAVLNTLRLLKLPKIVKEKVISGGVKRRSSTTTIEKLMKEQSKKFFQKL